MPKPSLILTVLLGLAFFEGMVALPHIAIAWTGRDGDNTARKGLLMFARNDREIYTARADGARLHHIATGAQPSWSPDGTKIAYTRTDTTGDCVDRCTKVYLVNVDGTGRRAASPTPNAPHTIQIDPSWAPDGNGIAFSQSSLPPDGFSLAVATIGEPPRFLTPDDGAWNEKPAWSPDAKWICFSRDAQDAPGLYLVRAKGNDQHLLLVTGAPAQWSPDSQRLLLLRGKGVYTIAVDGTDLRLVAARGDSPAWSPDGRRILFSDGTGLIAINVNRSARIRLTRVRADRNAVWSPDGAKIAFERGADIWQMNANGSGQHLLVHDGGRPAWQPR